MTKPPFIQPRFVGPRFEGHSLPLSAAKDLEAYEDLVLELAKHLYRQKNPRRARTPRGFATGFSLHIERIDDGSAMPALVAWIPGMLSETLPPEITEAKDLINSVIATEAGQSFPTNFPRDLYSYFNRIGRSLEEGEQIEWLPDSPTNKTVLTPTKRKRLVLANRETYEAEINVLGLVEELNSKSKTGTLRTRDHETIPFNYDDPFFAELRASLGSKTTYVRVKGIGVFDGNDRLGSVTEIEQIETLPHFALVSAIEALADLPTGWLEGHGSAPSSDRLNWLSNEVTRAFPESLEYPSVVPTEEGHVIFEWMRSHSRIELEFNFSENRIELYATNLNTKQFTEQPFETGQWGEAFAAIQQMEPGRSPSRKYRQPVT
jgi:hypothetical protein